MKMMGPYDRVEPLALLIEKLENGKEFAQAGRQTIAYAMMVSKGITLLAQTEMFNRKYESGDVKPPTRRYGRT